MRHWLWVMLLVSWFAWADTTCTEDDQRLLRQMYDVEQMWVMSENYRHGATVPQDLPRAYAWLSLYITSLPNSYPGTQAMLTDLATELTSEQVAAGKALVDELRQQYQLENRLSEQAMRRIFALHEQGLTQAVEPSTPEFTESFVTLLGRLRESGAGVTATQLAERMGQLKQQADKRSTIVYGKVTIAGAEDPQNVMSRVMILPEGYFIGMLRDSKDKIVFGLRGYQTRYISLPTNSQAVVNVGAIHMQPVDVSVAASVVGQVIAENHQDIKVVLQLEPFIGNETIDDIDDRDLWWRPVIPVVMLDSGEFYVMDLAPMDYRLIIARQGTVLVDQKIRLTAGEVRHTGSFSVG